MKLLNILLALSVSLSYLFFLQVYSGFLNPNETSRFLVTSAIVDDHTFQIERAIDRYGDTQDKAAYQGHFYSVKPIGYSVFAVPFYWALHAWLFGAPMEFNIWVMRIFLNFIPLIFFSIFFFRFLAGLVPGKAELLIVAFLFGSLFFTFTQLFMSHTLTGIFWFTGFYFLLWKPERGGAIIAGLLIGLAFLVDLLTVIPGFIFSVYLLVRNRRLLIPFALTVGIVALPTFIFNAHYFGSPLEWPYKHFADPEFRSYNTQGYVGLLLPSPAALWGLTFGTSRGLFYYMPHLLFGLYGLITEKEHRAAALIALFTVLGTTVLVSGMVAWHGGWTFGPRYILPVIPFLIFGTALWLQRQKSQLALSLYVTLLAITIIAMMIGTATWPFSPRSLPNPILWENLTFFWRGFFGANIGQMLGFSDTLIRFAFITIVVLSCLLLMACSAISRSFKIYFALLLIVLFPLSFPLQRFVEKRIPADHCFNIGRAGFYQGQYPKAREFLQLALQRNPDPNTTLLAKYYLRLMK